MGYDDPAPAVQAHKTDALLEEQIAVSLETNELLRRLLASHGVLVALMVASVATVFVLVVLIWSATMAGD